MFNFFRIVILSRTFVLIGELSGKDLTLFANSACRRAKIETFANCKLAYAEVARVLGSIPDPPTQ
jgi:hypothetical protein